MGIEFEKEISITIHRILRKILLTVFIYFFHYFHMDIVRPLNHKKEISLIN